jgi:predicted AlkP superfamily pyrophosphatase or phosphodiesterase
MISIDGLRPASIADPQLKLPNLKRLVAEGVSAEVRGVLPSVTYSSHTTLVTGVYPARHGIFSNRPFEILHKNLDAWFWYSQDIRMPTLWDVAARAGYIVGSVSWPVTVGSTSIRYNLPEFAGTRTSEDIKMIRALAGQAWFDEIARKAGPYLTDVNQAIPRDQARTQYAAELIRQRHTRFLTVHLAALDHAQHEHGPASDEANRALEAIDAMTGQLRDAMRAEDARAAICVVSDHGFAPVERALKLEAAFVREGFIKLRAERESLFLSGVAEWQAMPWPAGGSAAIVLREPGNQAARTKVREFLTKLASDPANGIAGILEEAEIARFGGAPSAAFWVDMRPGFGLSGSLAGPLTAATPGKGAHGYSPSHSEMRAFFALEGAGIPGGARLGEIDMRSIAPTVAGLLGAAMPSAELPALRLGK